jgi:hypothetical protein
MISDETVQDSRYRRMGDKIVPVMSMLSDVKTKTIELVLDALYANSKVMLSDVIQKIYDQDKVFWFNLFPKPQIGGPREIAIQDFFTRLCTYICERISETLSKSLDSESLTDKEKFRNMSEAVYRARREEVETHSTQSDKEPTLYAFNNEDNSRWGPGMLPIAFTQCQRDLLKSVGDECFEFQLNCMLQMANKMIEIPRVIYSKWDNDFVEIENHPMKDMIKASKIQGRSVLRFLSV